MNSEQWTVDRWQSRSRVERCELCEAGLDVVAQSDKPGGRGKAGRRRCRLVAKRVDPRDEFKEIRGRRDGAP